MKKLINKGRRRLGVPGRPAIILQPNESIVLNESRAADLVNNRTAVRWLERGVLVLTEYDGAEEEPKPVIPKPIVRRPQRPGLKMKRDDREPVVIPDGLTGEGIERHHLGGGWYEVWVNGFKVTDKNVRKDEAISIEGEYE